ncbi:hypothetical protein KAFR_0E03780 [Kazachstania africana CBS 2517]|uniref:NADPH:adrenodoxin oxidoreductase, mitochondrial n=1 Tax=Kazachstania africana (strain ATCC 22294 / BCRC 22015 / CBS 2517 / CECT 1963 / NBRC 1671 / NRRL Y-8276) TaxID=1071382 RepID=H2AVX9_KAZAF|nr:hypothetical protein KAFR_0E03780 [Kazachstania africana CBS 2517]CCF58529.1 hypothetical protein KAFR_0E03780 [Kazachstania africana CBS 2517]
MKNVSIVGSGPAGFYTAYRLLKKAVEPLSVKIWEKRPIPFGLSRFGVAPDHPEVKNCEETFTSIFTETLSNGHKVQFLGDVEIGNGGVKLMDLLSKEDVVVLSYGCSDDRRLHIPGEANASGVFTSREFVNWYNGDLNMSQPDSKLNQFDWNKVKNVGIIGNGNVALDITRVLISNKIKEIWDPTDISVMALEKLRKAPIENIKIIGRRDFVHSKFTNKELRELWELEKFGIHGKIDSKYFDPEQLLQQFGKNRPLKRRIEMCMEYLKPFEKRSPKYKKFEQFAGLVDTPSWELDYLKTPVRINSDIETGAIKSLTLHGNKISEENRLTNDGTEYTYNIDLLIESLGYKGKPLQEFDELGIKFNDHVSTNAKGQVLTMSDAIVPRLYATGWIRTGSKGVIAATMQDAFTVADSVLNEVSATNANLGGFNTQDIPHTTWSDWEKINLSEISKGAVLKKSRLKYLSYAEMLRCLD